MKLIKTLDAVSSETGKYHAFWIADLSGIFIIEWIGTMNSLPSINRQKITISVV